MKLLYLKKKRCVACKDYLSDYDGTWNGIFELCGKPFGKPLAYIFSKSLTAGKFLNHVKCSVVNLLFKKGGKSELTNYIHI
jgi:hypothetical protein